MEGNSEIPVLTGTSGPIIDVHEAGRQAQQMAETKDTRKEFKEEKQLPDYLRNLTHIIRDVATVRSQTNTQKLKEEQDWWSTYKIRHPRSSDDPVEQAGYDLMEGLVKKKVNDTFFIMSEGVSLPQHIRGLINGIVTEGSLDLLEQMMIDPKKLQGDGYGNDVLNIRTYTTVPRGENIGLVKNLMMVAISAFDKADGPLNQSQTAQVSRIKDGMQKLSSVQVPIKK